jgi:superfamily I DNA and/or RNA helicase
LVIFDEASQIRVEDAFTGLLKGRTVVIAGDRHQMPPSNWFEADTDDRLTTVLTESVTDVLAEQALHAESILDFAIQHRYFGDTYLTYHYRSEHADLIAFSNAAFYGNLKPMALNHIQQPFGFHAVNGLYGGQTNEQEAMAVVKWLLAVEPNERDELPSIGVATLNLKQRDLILKLLMRERRLSDEANSKVARLEEAGLFIRNLENIQGDERDIIVLSTTFGVNEEGLFSRHFGKLGTRAGYRLLNVLVTRARTHIHVFS